MSNFDYLVFGFHTVSNSFFLVSYNNISYCIFNFIVGIMIFLCYSLYTAIHGQTFLILYSSEPVFCMYFSCVLTSLVRFFFFLFMAKTASCFVCFFFDVIRSESFVPCCNDKGFRFLCVTQSRILHLL